MNLLIVESPAKAKTIEKILGKDFIVKSSFGHVRDLEKGDGAVDVSNGFEPKYVVSAEKKKVVKELKEQVRKADEVWLATDEDREGEAISWHLCHVLGLDVEKTKRIVFHEITPPAIQKAVKNPRKVDIDLVNAQQARRVLDRLVGYELSGILWRKIKGNLSAGRVQSVALKLVVEREREINKFNSTPFFKVSADFVVENSQGKKVILPAEAPARFDKELDARQFLEKCIQAIFSIRDIEVRPLKRKPAPPFTTSTLQQEASRKLGFSVNRTMTVAQHLYEAGHITYMRTDSVNLSDTALASIGQEIEKNYGKKYHHFRKYSGKSANAQEAHEAIRPTYIDRQVVSAGRDDEQRLYELIWKRTIASQMAEAELEKTVVQIGISTMPSSYLQSEGEVLKFDGFLKVYLESNDDEEEEEAKGMLPPLKKEQVLPMQKMEAVQRFTRPPARYTEAGLVQKLEELGIGRPSTYAPTISKIMEESRGYVEKLNRDGAPRAYTILTLSNGLIKQETKSEIAGAVKNRLVPTDMGITVCDFLDQHFDEIMNYGFTAEIEKQFDEIAGGNKQWRDMLKDFYFPFHKVVEQTTAEAARPSRERILGKDPATSRTVLVRMTRNGPVVQIGAQDELAEKEKPRYANLQPGQSIETITFEEAVKLFQLPKTLGNYKGLDMVVGIGRFGPYVLWDGKYASIPKGVDPLTVDMEAGIEYMEQKLKEDAPVATYKGEPVTKGKGRFGPFVKWRELFVNVPKKYDFDNLTTAEVHELIEAKIKKEANRYIHQWPEENINIENGRWGPFIKFGKQMINIPKKDGQKVTSELAAQMTLEEFKAIIVASIPDAFTKKKKPEAKKGSKGKKK